MSRNGLNVLRWVGAAILALLSLAFVVYVIFLCTYQPIEHPPIIVEESPASYTEDPAPVIESNFLNETKRREIYLRNAKIESDATRESETIYPLPEKVDSTYHQRVIDQMYKQWEYQDRVIAERRVFLYKQYDITENQLFKIMWEGVQKHWPY